MMNSVLTCLFVAKIAKKTNKPNKKVAKYEQFDIF